MVGRASAANSLTYESLPNVIDILPQTCSDPIGLNLECYKVSLIIITLTHFWCVRINGLHFLSRLAAYNSSGTFHWQQQRSQNHDFKLFNTLYSLRSSPNTLHEANVCYTQYSKKTLKQLPTDVHSCPRDNEGIELVEILNRTSRAPPIVAGK